MTVPVERFRTRKPVTWLTILGIVALPVLLGGLLVAALYNPVERLDNMKAAIVNDDVAVTIDGQYVPLGRQLTAGLVEGSADAESNLDWTITNDSDAAAGLADGTYAAVITIPENFSAAATSTSGDADPEQATIQVATAPDAKVVDDAVTSQLASVAASVLGTQLSEVYLENVFLGFTTLGNQLGEAASGADELTAGAQSAASGADQLTSGIGEISSGAWSLSSGANDAASGLSTLAGGASELASGSAQLTDGLNQIAAQLPTEQLVPQEYIDIANSVAEYSPQINQALVDAANEFSALAASCDATTTPELCAQLTAAAAEAQSAVGTASEVIGQAGTLASGLESINQLPALGDGIRQLAASSSQITSGIQGIADGTSQAASGVSALGSGAASLASGAEQAGTGAAELASGLHQLADGNGTLATGLHTAADALPSYTDEQAADLASVVADPVVATGVDSNLFGAAAIPLLSALALWFGGLATYVVFGAISRNTLTSRSSSAALALRTFLPGAVVGALQGVLVAGVVQIAASYDWGQWSLYAALCALAGIAFAAVNQALVALFGGAGRWVAAIAGALAIATGIISTVPGVIASLGQYLPTTPAYNAMLGALGTAGGVGAGVVGMLVWTLLALLGTVFAVSRHRHTTAHAVLAEAT